MQDFMAAIQNKDEKKIIHLLHSKQAVGKQMHQTVLTFKRNYTSVLYLWLQQFQPSINQNQTRRKYHKRKVRGGTTTSLCYNSSPT